MKVIKSTVLVVTVLIVLILGVTFMPSIKSVFASSEPAKAVQYLLNADEVATEVPTEAPTEVVTATEEPSWSLPDYEKIARDRLKGQLDLGRNDIQNEANEQYVIFKYNEYTYEFFPIIEGWQELPVPTQAEDGKMQYIEIGPVLGEKYENEDAFFRDWGTQDYIIRGDFKTLDSRTSFFPTATPTPAP